MNKVRCFFLYLVEQACSRTDLPNEAVSRIAGNGLQGTVFAFVRSLDTFFHTNIVCLQRDEIDLAMRNNMMNYEATLNDLKRRRQQQQQQQQAQQQGNMPMQQSSANSGSTYGDGFKTGLTGMGAGSAGNNQAAASAGAAVGQAPQSHLMQQQQPHQDMSKAPGRGPAVPNIEALAHQLSVAARQGIISSRLLTQPLAPQTTYLLHKVCEKIV